MTDRFFKPWSTPFCERTWKLIHNLQVILWFIVIFFWNCIPSFLLMQTRNFWLAKVCKWYFWLHIYPNGVHRSHPYQLDCPFVFLTFCIKLRIQVTGSHLKNDIVSEAKVEIPILGDFLCFCPFLFCIWAQFNVS